MLLLSLASCSPEPSLPQGKLTIGVVSYEQGDTSVKKFTQFNAILSKATNSLIELEPTFNERKALDQIKNQSWDVVFASPGIAAVAIANYRYIPIFPVEGRQFRSVLIVQQESPIQTLQDMTQKKLALGQIGSATGYYLPLFDLYGLTLAEVQFSSTPEALVSSVSTGEVDVGALAKHEFDQYSAQSSVPLRVVHTSRPVPGGSVLLSANVDRNLQEIITQTMNQIPPAIAEDVGFIPNTDPPDYQYLIELVKKVDPIAANLDQKPALLFSSTP
jgi:phosphonate transport system substrate-binding protein